MTTLYQQYKEFIEPRDPPLAPPHASRICQNCQQEQPGSATVNQPCVFCDCPVVMWDTKREAK